jgi:hypothetical protein
VSVLSFWWTLRAQLTSITTDLASSVADFDRRDHICGLAERSDVLHVGIQLAVREQGSDDLEDATGWVPLDRVRTVQRRRDRRR